MTEQEWMFQPSGKRFVDQPKITVFEGIRKFVAQCGKTYAYKGSLQKHQKECFECRTA